MDVVSVGGNASVNPAFCPIILYRDLDAKTRATFQWRGFCFVVPKPICADVRS